MDVVVFKMKIPPNSLDFMPIHFRRTTYLQIYEGKTKETS